MKTLQKSFIYKLFYLKQIKMLTFTPSYICLFIYYLVHLLIYMILLKLLFFIKADLSEKFMHK